MLTPPSLPDAALIAALRDAYRLPIAAMAFLPLGADRHTAVYRATGDDGAAYFVKLRSGGLDETSVILPRLLSDQGIAPVIPPLVTTAGTLWTSVKQYTLVLYPFVEGRNGYEIDLSEQNWHDLGTALKRLHTVLVPPALARRIRRETYSAPWRESVRDHVTRADAAAPTDRLAAELVAVLKAYRGEILRLVARAEALALDLQRQPRECVLCHADIHAGNVLIEPSGTLHIVDWDDVVFAPKERDLMFVGGGLWNDKRAAEEEETLFYRGYGPAPIDGAALAYYRYERIVQDIAVECELIRETERDEGERARELRFLKSNFLPGGTIERARRADGNTR